MKQLPVDLVILNEHAASYAQDLQTTLEGMVRPPSRGHHLERRRAEPCFILRADLVSADVRSLLQSVARAVLFSRRGSLFDQVRRLEKRRLPSRRPRDARP